MGLDTGHDDMRRKISDRARDKILKLAMLRLSYNTPGQYSVIEALRGH